MFVEKVNVKVLNKLSKISLKQFSYLMDMSETKRSKKDGYNYKEEYTKVINYCKEYQKEGKIEQDYRYEVFTDPELTNRKYPDNGLGRRQATKPSIQRLFNGVRGILCDNIMIDIDIKYCHNQILINLCKKYDIKYNYIQEYIDHREDKLNELMKYHKINRAEAKNAFLSPLNKIVITKEINSKNVKKNSFYEKYDMQTKEILNRLFDIYSNKDEYNGEVNRIKKEAIKKDKDWNYKGMFISLILRTEEDKILKKAIKFINKNYDFDIGVLMFDGMMIYKNDDINYDEVIDKLNEYFEKYGSYRWDIKPHAIDLLKYLDELEDKDIFFGNELLDIAEHILENKLKDKLISCCGNMYYMGDFKIKSHRDEIKSDLYQFIKEQNYFQKKMTDQGEKNILISRIHKNIKDLVDCLLNIAPTNPSFLNEVWDYTQFKLFFKNGYIDFKQNKFIEGKYNKTFIKINRDYIKSNNEEIRKQIYDKIFNPIFTVNKKMEDRKELLDNFLYTTAHFLAGDIELKKWINFQGMRNSGKGIICDVLKNTFEDYIVATNASNFFFKKNNNDSQKILSWVMDYEYCRIAMTSEVSITDDGKLDGNMIKSFTGGGDWMSARKNFQDERQFRIQAGLIICCNDMPKVEPNHALEMCQEYQMKSKFIDETFNENEKFENIIYYQKDNTLKSHFLKDPKVINEFVNIFIEHYNKEVLYPEKYKVEFNDDDNDYVILKELFEITKNQKDFIDNDLLKNICKDAKICFTLKKIKILLTGQGASVFRKGNKRGLSGIKLKADFDSDNEDYNDL